MFHMKCYVFVFFDKCSLKKKNKKQSNVLFSLKITKKNVVYCNLTFKVSHLALDNMTKHCALDNMTQIFLKGQR